MSSKEKQEELLCCLLRYEILQFWFIKLLVAEHWEQLISLFYFKFIL